MRTRTALWAALLLLGIAAPAHAQGAIGGVVLDNRSDTPLEAARVTVLSQGGRRLRSTLTGPDGRFDFELRPGYYRFQVQRLGFVEVNTPHVRVVHEAVSVELRMRDDALMLAPVTVVSRSGRVSPVLSGFYERMRGGMGRYVTREQISQRQPSTITDVLTGLPGVRTSTRRSGIGRDVVIARAASRAGGCPVQLYLDGVLINRPPVVSGQRDSASYEPIGDAESISIDHLAAPSEVEGIEVYYGLASVPAEFMGPDARCGTIAIWTRER